MKHDMNIHQRSLDYLPLVSLSRRLCMVHCLLNTCTGCSFSKLSKFVIAVNIILKYY